MSLLLIIAMSLKTIFISISSKPEFIKFSIINLYYLVNVLIFRGA